MGSLCWWNVLDTVFGMGTASGWIVPPSGPGAVVGDALIVLVLAAVVVFAVRAGLLIVRMVAEQRQARRSGEDRLPNGKRLTALTSVKTLNRSYFPDRDPTRPNELRDGHVNDEDRAPAWPRRWSHPHRH